NVSLGLGLCPQRQWEKLIQGTWVHSMSPYDTKLLEIRMPGPSLELIEVSLEEEFMLYRVIFLVLGVVMLAMAPCLSKSIVFYYSGAMAVGVILVILMVLFQGMRLLPSGRNNSLAIVIYSSLVGVGSFMLRYVPGLLHSLLVEIGISDDMYTPLVSLLLVCFILAGAWLGFWVVRKLVLTEDGDVDLSVALFVAWSIRILSAVMIIQSSLDPLLATEALVSGVLVSSLMRRLTKLRFSHLLPQHVFRAKKSSHRKFRTQDSHSEYLHNEFRSRLSEEAEFLKHRTERFTLASPNSPATDLTKTPRPHSSDLGSYVSTFHKTPERKILSKEEWDSSTRDFTKKGLEELVSSPEFNKWAVRNAERITLAPSRKHNSEQRSRWLPWL
ncbi:transmembrane protein, partial [Thalictrum thalictroides]